MTLGNSAQARIRVIVWRKGFAATRSRWSNELVAVPGTYRFHQGDPVTHFPMEGVVLWFANNVIYLPSEH